MPPEHVLEEMDRESEISSANERAAVVKNGEPKDEPNKRPPHEYVPGSKVRFELINVKVHYVKPRFEYTSEEYQATWYRLCDFSRINSWNRMAVKIMRQQGTLEKEPDHCIRGLENKVKAGDHDRIRDIRVHSVYAVLKEQRLQRLEHQTQQQTLYDFEKMAAAYRKYTFSCEAEAHEWGLRDERDANETIVLQAKQKKASFDEDDLTQLKELDVTLDESDRFEKRVMQLDSGSTESSEDKRKKKSKMKRLGIFFSKRNKSPKRDTSPKRDRSREKPPKREHSPKREKAKSSKTEKPPKKGEPPKREISKRTTSPRRDVEEKSTTVHGKRRVARRSSM
jgi:hypothetical protein